mmetsp:Transcript_36433/g.34445  ORF Transcript_36433/g.34445 Transcript_36433/m.34445 type:complete len:262 (+) Transcript_36433:300-1085(+)
MKRSFHVHEPVDILSYQSYNKRLKGENGEGLLHPWTSSNFMESLSVQDQEKIGTLNTLYHNGNIFVENKHVDNYDESLGESTCACDSQVLEGGELKSEDRDSSINNTILRDLYLQRERRKSQKNQYKNQANLSPSKSGNNHECKHEKSNYKMSSAPPAHIGQLHIQTTSTNGMSSHFRQQSKFQKEYEERKYLEEIQIEIFDREKNEIKNEFDCEHIDISPHALKGFRYQNIDQLPLLSLNESIGEVTMDVNDSQEMEVEG